MFSEPEMLKICILIISSEFLQFLDKSYGPDAGIEHPDIGRTLSTPWSSWILQYIYLWVPLDRD